MRSIRLAAFLLAAGLAFGGQSAPYPGRRTLPPPKTAPPAAAKAAKPAAAPDPLIEAAIRAKFAKSKISADKFQVHVQGGVATIEGKTDTIQHKGVATRLAKSGGAVAVNNHIETSQAAKDKAAA
ncbi:MAG TPA: BON domain-containing protein, partial [Bryobacteraceae bacterium]|nr:BON domain-containing protein [Bryobacteraceae bacterium]